MARIWIILNEGGIYLDTDVELLSDKIDNLINYSCWFAMEDMRYVSTGLGFGAEKYNTILNDIINDYLNRDFDYQACSHINTSVIKKYTKI